MTRTRNDTTDASCNRIKDKSNDNLRENLYILGKNKKISCIND